MSETASQAIDRSERGEEPIHVLTRLRRATRTRHEELETNAGVLERLAHPGSRRGLLEAFLSLYEPAEAALRPHLEAVDGLDFAERQKVPTLLRDLRALGAGEDELAQIPRAAGPRLAGRAQAIGFAYVLEGSTLGGRVILKRLRAAGLPLDGLGFFDIYGAAAGRRFSQFCAVLERECADHSGEAVAGAVLGFDYVRQGLAPKAA